MATFIEVLPLLLLCVAGAFLWALATGSRLAFVSVLLASTATLVGWLLVIWFLRDGMGPDAVTSTGNEAWHRFLQQAVVPLAGWSAINIASLVRYRSPSASAA